MSGPMVGELDPSPRPGAGRLGRSGNLAVAYLLANLATPVMAQQGTLRVTSEIQCQTCRIEVGEAREFVGEYEDGTVPDLAITIVAGPGSRFFIVWESVPYEVHVHGMDGALVRTVGRAGEGPGEFRAARYLEQSGGILRVGDPGLRRVTEFDASTGELLRTVSDHPVNGRFAVLDDGRFVWSGPVRTRAEAGYPLHVYSRTGNWERSYGVDDPVLHPDMAELLVRVVVPGPGSTFWAASPNEYRIEHWDASGSLLRAIVGDRPWFDPWHSIGRVEVSREVPPPPILSGLALDEDGLLWVLVSRPSDTWRDSFTGEMDSRGNPVRDPDLLYTSVLEVLDPRTGQMLAFHTFPNVVRLAGPGAIWRTWADERGLPRAAVTPVRLVGRP